MVDFDRCRSLLSGNNRFRLSTADFRWYQPRKKAEEGEPGHPMLPDPDPSLAGFLALRGDSLRRSWGEENDA
ncbi:hypothetical protein B296_00016634 [Ensete ventricosum]|uniref:Uncharacterized protein n=1 Tax=Ensete ventricosum TaxID=4639 RepID=A0A426XNK8_ENSVE|nr:hypothetical protein B296_00016634 [Ensete ventricosum]